MPTFFEKLTNGRAPNAPAPTDDRESENGSSRAGRRVSPQTDDRTTHLAIETEQEPMTLSNVSEEEGELTVDIYDRGEEIMIQSTVAGVRPEDLDVSITNDTVSIRGRRSREEEVEEKSYYYKELFWGGFSRSVLLPEEIDDENAEATLKHGLLTIRLPKRKKGMVQKLKVKVV